jgi:hypothetical protein
MLYVDKQKIKPWRCCHYGCQLNGQINHAEHTGLSRQPTVGDYELDGVSIGGMNKK